MTTTTTNKVHHLPTPTLTAPVVVNLVPTPGAPRRPDGAVLNVKHPRLNQRTLNAAASAAVEVHAATAYGDFGGAAPPQATVVDALTSVGAWRAEERAAKQWYQYVRAQLTGAAAHAVVAVGPLEGPFDALTAHRPELALSYRALATYFKAKRDVGKAAAVPRAKNNRAKAKGGTASATASTPETAAAPATPVTPAAPGGGSHSSG